MEYQVAKKQLKHALVSQKTIRISKLKEILQSINFSFESRDSKEVEYLKGEIKSLRKRNRRLESRRNESNLHRRF